MSKWKVKAESALVRTVDGVYPMLDGTQLFDHKGTIYTKGAILNEEDFLPTPDLKALKGDFKKDDMAMQRMHDHLHTLFVEVSDDATADLDDLFEEDNEPRMMLVHGDPDAPVRPSPFSGERESDGPLEVESLAGK